jgi:hypothetical protein
MKSVYDYLKTMAYQALDNGSVSELGMKIYSSNWGESNVSFSPTEIYLFPDGSLVQTEYVNTLGSEVREVSERVAEKSVLPPGYAWEPCEDRRWCKIVVVD